MNLKSIEAQFQKIDSRAKRISEYFNPVARGRKQHPYIKEIKEDFDEDSKIYSLNKYLYTNKLANSSSLPPVLKQIDEVKPEEIKKKIHYMVPKRKQLKIDSMKELKPELKYKGSFSITKLLPDRKNPKVSQSMQFPRHVDSWAEGISIQSYPESLDYSSISIENDLKQVKTYPENISSEYIKESFSQLTKFSSKNSRYNLSPDDFLFNSNKLKSPGDDLIVKYQTDPNLRIKAEKGEHSLHICDINLMTYRDYIKVEAFNGFLVFNGSKKLNLEHEFGNIWGHTFQICIDRCKRQEVFYVCFSKFSKETQDQVMRSIRNFKDVQKAQNTKRFVLPKINEKDSVKRGNDLEFNNPITAALMRFRNKAKAFKPESYLAKLSLFETHAYIREKYS